jgi:hypothetical protein
MAKSNTLNWYAYTVKGKLDKTKDQEPPSFTVTGLLNEKSQVQGWPHQQKSKGTFMVPNSYKPLIAFLERIPLGTVVIFKDTTRRVDKKSVGCKYSIEVVEKKKIPKKRR